MAEDKLKLPTSGGGLVSYKDEYKTKFNFSPVIIIVLIILVVIFEYILHKFINIG